MNRCPYRVVRFPRRLRDRPSKDNEGASTAEKPGPAGSRQEVLMSARQAAAELPVLVAIAFVVVGFFLF